jgi:hypothetical protein
MATPERVRSRSARHEQTNRSLMRHPPRQHPPAHYQLRVEGHLDTHWSAHLDDLAVAWEDDGTTTLTGLVQDQSQLHGLLAKIRDLGLTLISVEVLNDPQRDESSRAKGT